MQLLLAIYSIILGLVIGSFLNVCILRYQSHEPISKGRSHCPKCNHTLSWYELIPLFSWIGLKGKCKHCHQPISIQYPIVESLTAICFLILYLKFGITLDTLIYFIFASVLIYAAVIDLQTMIIPDRTHILCLLCGVLLLILHPSQLTDRLIGAVVVCIPLLIIAYLTKGMGYGDVKLMGAAGFVLGWQNILLSMMIASITASIVGIISTRMKKTSLKSEMPLGPHLIFAILFCLVYGQSLINWYLSSFF
ncbi:prepilin peptidase [Anaerorhabdus sp.]|uniref:prepilin peptidase n=1 Tax=Anaerorhabdus sp. TaxID=1872524 RepID=UPI002FC72326